jgi:hypothetical protein
MRTFYLLFACLLGLSYILPNAILHAQTRVVCQGEAIQLSANAANLYEWIPATGLDDPYSATPFARPNVSTTYRVSRLQTSNNLITNGNFSAGNSGFTTAYIDSTGINVEGYFIVANNPSQHHNAMNPCTDHTGSRGNMMIVNGAPIANHVIWSQSITIQPNTNYAFSTWVNAGISPGSRAVLQFSINGQLLATPFATTYAYCDWHQFYATWNSGSSTSAVISIVNQNLERSGNDLALDDILFQSFTTITDSVRVNVLPALPAPAVTQIGDSTPCQGTTVTLSGPANALGYRWNTGPNQNFVGRTLLTDTSGTYYLQVLGSNNCYSFPSDTISISVQPLPTAPVITAGTSATTICQGDSVLLTARGELGTTTIWSTGQIGTSVYVTSQGVITAASLSAEGCRSVASNPVTITYRSRPATPRVSIVGDSTFCQGDSAVLTSSSRTNNFWSTGATTQSITVRSTGVYSVYLQSSTSCPSARRSVRINVTGAASRPVITPSASLFICPGDSLTLTSSALTGNLWSTGSRAQAIRVGNAGSFTVTATTNCGNSTSQPIVTTLAQRPARPVIRVGTNNTLVAQTQGTQPVLHQWFRNGLAIPNATGVDHIAVQSGVYRVLGFSGASCRSDTSNPIDFTPTSTNTRLLLGTIAFAPSPAKGSTMLKLTGTLAQTGLDLLTVTDLQGRIITTIEAPRNMQSINLVTFPAGLYIVYAQAGSAKHQLRLVVE